ncbi:MAG TPA: DUF4302 domain-containing protein [Chitinophaga sp.]|uniref:DUF4302 domain-containing protein n=1 Tax=Chitinophaga sp. TaxID=1869181 RepID=UPI002C24D11F|nr:DUF4302 domain-containing protein [Chitinophaga sp.]HVI46346.1 DUF4302 domain-containing protein [Chitinophaga sp.]
MKTIHKLFAAFFIGIGLTACVKYKNDINLEDAQAKQAALTSKVRQQLGDAPNGWLLMVPNLDPTIRTAIPIVLKFDVAKGVVNSTSPFPASLSSVPSLFELSSATGAPLLSFATGSIFSGWYEAGGITDYYFKILSVSADSISMQPYRKGNVYASEGGIPMVMYRLKTPATWFDKPYDLKAILTGKTAPLFNNANNPLKLTYKDGYQQPAWNMEFDGVAAGDMAFWQRYVPFTRYLGMIPIYLFSNGNYTVPGVYYCGNNALVSHLDNGFTPAPWFIDQPKKFISAIKTDYLLVRNLSTDSAKVELFALDKYGNEIISGTLEAK